MQGKVSASAAVVLVLLCILSARGAALNERAWAEAEATVTATPVPILLFADDFGTYSGRWRESFSAKATAAYRDETLWMRVVSPGVAVWSVPDFQAPLADFDIQVTVQFNAGQSDGQAGILFGYADDEHFTAVLLSAEGRIYILARDGQQWEELTSQEGLISPVRFGESVLVRINRVGVGNDALLTVTVAGEPVAEFTLPAIGQGRSFGLIARAGRGYVDVSFDEVVVVTKRGED